MEERESLQQATELKLSVTSEVGRGSTFTLSIPERPWPES